MYSFRLRSDSGLAISKCVCRIHLSSTRKIQTYSAMCESLVYMCHCVCKLKKHIVPFFFFFLKGNIYLFMRVDQLWSVFGRPHRPLSLDEVMSITVPAGFNTGTVNSSKTCELTAWQDSFFCVTVSVHSEIDRSSFLSFGEEICGQRSGKPGTTSSQTATASVQNAKARGKRQKPGTILFSSKQLFIQY